MHEVSLVHEIMLIVMEVAEKEGLSRISKIKLLIGENMSVLPDALEFAFQYLKSGTLMEHAVLRWEICPGREFTISYIEGE
ncbi:hydrogenase maturation nickel metallochaperone HypA/HybF [Paenibacillus chungangensis]|uniref:Hydrogenase maturation nickel metallochaperone HypA n=1 Tax=Paenibacillus chungangensis TaxID=696535 RepID=A0ABW3HNH8_9BACL